MSISALSSSIASSAWSTMQTSRRQGPSADELFSKADVNGDGSIDEAEFSDIFANAPNGSSIDTAELFSTFDSDGDGQISQTEHSENFDAVRQQLDAQFESQRMSNAMQGMGGMPPPPPDADELFASTDSNGDGVITADELSAAIANGPQDGKAPDAAELFAALDADGDGQITQTEHSEGLSAMHEQGQSDAGTQTASGSEDALRALITSLLEQYKQNSGDTSSELYGSLLDAVA